MSHESDQNQSPSLPSEEEPSLEDKVADLIKHGASISGLNQVRVLVAEEMAYLAEEPRPRSSQLKSILVSAILGLSIEAERIPSMHSDSHRDYGQLLDFYTRMLFDFLNDSE